MQSKTLAGIALIVGFAGLWVPLGQHDFLYENWMKLGTLMFPFLVFAAFSFSAERVKFDLGDTKTIALLLLGAYVIHQFEEHWVDIFGNVYAFQASVNQMISAFTSAPTVSDSPLTAEGIFVINTSLVWLVGFVAIWSASDKMFPTLAMAAIVLVNGVVHITGAIALGSYNPGLLTSVVVFLPVSVLAYRWLNAPRLPWIASLLWALLAHILMVLGLMASTEWELMPPLTYHVLLVLWSLLPGYLSSFRALEDNDKLLKES